MALLDRSDLHEYGLDRANRRIYFGSMAILPNADDTLEKDHTVFNKFTVDLAIRNLHILIKDSQTKPIEIHMNSDGGCITSMLRLIDEIHACPCQIKFIGGGSICSAATWVMCVCDVRLLHPNTSVMLHDGSNSLDGTRTHLVVEMEEYHRTMETLYKLFADNSRMPIEFYRDILQRDVYLTAEETIQLGLADAIIEPKKRGNLRKVRQAALKKDVDVKEIKKVVHSIYKRIQKHRGAGSITINVPKKEACDKNIIVEEMTDIVEERQPATLTTEACDTELTQN